MKKTQSDNLKAKSKEIQEFSKSMKGNFTSRNKLSKLSQSSALSSAVSTISTITLTAAEDDDRPLKNNSHHDEADTSACGVRHTLMYFSKPNIYIIKMFEIVL